jgi:prepilin-type N-terminal cleavage/methylation domain-containing protein
MTTNQFVSLTPRFSDVALVADRLRTVSTVSPPSAATKSCRAFTFIELLIVLAVLALVACVLATARAGSRPNFQGAICLNNFKQLMAAFTMYTHDNNDYFPPNPDDIYSYSAGYSWVAGGQNGGMPVGSPANPEAGNPNLLTNPRTDLLANYIRTNISLFHCPFDPRMVRYTGSDTNLFGTYIPACRSISMNGGVGTKGAFAGGNAPVDGPWLDGNHTHRANAPYATFGKWSDFRVARPSDIWVLVDDDPWTINDAGIQVIASTPDLIDYPNIFNDNSTAFAFADGHGETHKWKSNLFIHNSVPGRTTAQPGIQHDDWFWWASHATRSTFTGTVP